MLRKGLLVLSALGWPMASWTAQPSPSPTVAPSPAPAATPARPLSTHFAKIDGMVQVRPAKASAWADADLRLVLHGGDFVRTEADSVAEIRFPDGTLVGMPPDSLITVEAPADDASSKERKVSWHFCSGEPVNAVTPGKVGSEVTEPDATGASPALTIEACEVLGAILLVRGSTEPAATVTVNDLEVATNEGHFNEFMAVDKTGKHTVVIRAVRVGGAYVERDCTVDGRH